MALHFLCMIVGSGLLHLNSCHDCTSTYPYYPCSSHELTIPPGPFTNLNFHSQCSDYFVLISQIEAFLRYCPISTLYPMKVLESLFHPQLHHVQSKNHLIIPVSVYYIRYQFMGANLSLIRHFDPYLNFANH